MTRYKNKKNGKHYALVGGCTVVETGGLDFPGVIYALEGEPFDLMVMARSEFYVEFEEDGDTYG